MLKSLILLILLFGNITLSHATLLNPRSPQELYNQDAYDKTEVYVDCKVTDMLIEDGRMGGKFLEIDCDNSKVVGYVQDIQPTDTWPFRVGNTVGLAGTFHKEGWVDGLPKDNFIDVRVTFTEHLGN
jgi:hypothetical protein